MRAREDQDAADVIAGIFSLFNTDMHTLIDPGSTHSFICTGKVINNMLCCEPLEYDVHVTSPLGSDVLVNAVHR